MFGNCADSVLAFQCSACFFALVFICYHSPSLLSQGASLNTQPRPQVLKADKPLALRGSSGGCPAPQTALGGRDVQQGSGFGSYCGAV